jgi:hypothetical protein
VRANTKCLSKFELNRLRSRHVTVRASNPRFPSERTRSSRAPTRALGAQLTPTRRRRTRSLSLWMAAATPKYSPLPLSRLLRTATSVVVDPSSVASDSFRRARGGSEKQMLRRFRSNVKKLCWLVDLKQASRRFYACKLDLMGHRWPEVMVI